ncbi:hypothetical protein [Massilia sp. BSC265]|uniref:hypothetical protein n=1 Tax=Massilia sp. BSC265 TaxID=1549812 RepID=UPI0004E895BB|nr:hypothetical protein [Massilia sp. BSC265]KFI06782.1 hypothetical protein JN27_14000 [Massilia sp. BSC265]
MKATFLTILVALAAGPVLLARADAPDTPRLPQPDPFARPATQATAPGQSTIASTRPSDEAIKAAVRAVLEEMPASAMPSSGTALSGGAYKEFARKFSEAEKPHCLGPNATRHQPSTFSTKNWNYGFGGLFALPFWGAAILRGKCSWNP